MQNIEYFDHTADVGIRLQRSSREALFRDAAFGMFYIIAPNNDFQAQTDYEISVENDDPETVMVNWLSELNYYFQVEGYVPVNMDIHFDDSGLHAKITGDIADPSVHNIETEIKAVTYHKIYVKQKNDAWQAQIIFDI